MVKYINLLFTFIGNAFAGLMYIGLYVFGLIFLAALSSKAPVIHDLFGGEIFWLVMLFACPVIAFFVNRIIYKRDNDEKAHIAVHMIFSLAPYFIEIWGLLHMWRELTSM